MRVIVAQPAQKSMDGGDFGPLQVGILRWLCPVQAEPELAEKLRFGPSPIVTVIAKATFSFAECASAADPAELAPEPEPLSLDQPDDREGAAEDDVLYPSDFVPFKPRCDVLLAGSAHADRPAARIRASLQVGSVSRSFVAVAGTPGTQIPLLGASIRGDDGITPADRVGAKRTPELLESHPDEFDFAAYQSAPLTLRTDVIGAGAVIELTGLSPRADQRLITLPGLAPRAYIDGSNWKGYPLPMRCDTLWIDTDRELVVLVWRGVLPVETLEAPEVERIVISLEREDKPRDLEAVRRDLPRGVFTPAVELSDLLQEESDGPPESGEVALARYETWDQTPEPTITLEKYATVSAELSEARQPRAECLKRHSLNEDGWALEERAWLEKMADAAMAGDAELATRFGDLFIDAQDALAAPGEGRETIDEYAAIKVQMEDSGDPETVLHERSMTLPQWMRLDRRWTRDGFADKRLKAEVDRRIEAYRIRYARQQRGEE